MKTVIDNPQKALNAVRAYYASSDKALVSALHLNEKGELIGVCHNRADLDESWRKGIVYDACREKDCEKVIVLYKSPDDECLPSQDSMKEIAPLKAMLNKVNIQLTDVIEVGVVSLERTIFYSYADESIYIS